MLEKRYAERGRAYHNLEHISACLNALDVFANQKRMTVDSSRHIELELALWFHDAIYDSKRKDNEQKSAQVFERLFGGYLSSNSRKSIVRLILATKHDKPPATALEKIIVDIDLTILGAPREVFDTYERAIRREYGWVPIGKFRAGRAAVLRHFLARKRIYSTRFFRTLYEMRARANLKRSLRKLRAT